MKVKIETSGAPGAIGPYSQAIRAGNLIFVSGQVPVDPATGTIPDDIAGQTDRCLQNASAILKEAGTDLSSVVDVQVFLTDMSEFAAMNDVYAGYFSQPFPARAAVAVAALPLGVKVEIKVTAQIDE